MSTTKQTKTFQGSTNSQYWSWKLEITEQFNDDYLETNESIIIAKTYLGRLDSNSYFGGTAQCNINVNEEHRNIDKTFTYPTYVNAGQWILVQTETFEVKHDDDGTKTISVGSSMTADFSPTYSVATGEIELTTIPRTSKVTCPSFNIGDSTVINIERASSSFKHTLTYKFGTVTGTIATKTSSTSVGWTPTADTLHAQIPNAKSGIGTITCQTYSGDTLIGTSTCNFTAYVTQSNPDVSATIVDTNSTTIALTGDSTKLIKYFSKPKITISATAKKKASITLYKTVLADGQSSTSNPITFSKIDAQQITVSATDSRGWSNSKIYNPTFINYIKLAFTSIDIDRTESTSTTVNAKITGNYFNGSFGSISNTLTMKWRYKLSTSSTWGAYTTVTATISGNTFSFNSTLGSSFNNNNDYDFEFVITDKLMSNISTGIVQVSKGVGIIDIYKNLVQINETALVSNKFIVGNLQSKNMIKFNPYNYWGIYINNNQISFSGSSAVNTYVGIPKTKFYKNIESGTELTLSARIINGADNYVSGWIQIGAKLNFTDGTFYNFSVSFDTSNQKYEVRSHTFLIEKNVESIEAVAGRNCDAGDGLTIGLQLEQHSQPTELTSNINFSGDIEIIPGQEFATNQYVEVDGVLKRVCGYQYNLTSPTILNEDVEVADLPSDFKKLRRVECMFYFGGYQVPDYGGVNGIAFVNGGKLQMSMFNQAYCGRPIEIIIYYTKN